MVLNKRIAVWIVFTVIIFTVIYFAFDFKRPLSVIENNFGIKIDEKCFEGKTLKEEFSPNGDGEKLLFVKAKSHRCWVEFTNELKKRYVLTRVNNNLEIQDILYQLLGIRNSKGYLFVEKRDVSDNRNIELLILDVKKQKLYFYISIV